MATNDVFEQEIRDGLASAVRLLREIADVATKAADKLADTDPMAYKFADRDRESVHNMVALVSGRSTEVKARLAQAETARFLQLMTTTPKDPK